ncbi:hypothetical protein J6590_045212 [Homalodisca vitripennis]|nr:hypothetical protein J6590_045212 [Homalodisca vitripennis]
MEVATTSGKEKWAEKSTTSSSGIPPGYSVLNPPLQGQIPGIAHFHATSPSGHKTDQDVINVFQHQKDQLAAAKSAYEQDNFARKISQTQMSHSQVVQHQTLPGLLTDNQHLMMSLNVDHELLPSQAEPNVTAIPETSVNDFQQQFSYQKKVKSQE